MADTHVGMTVVRKLTLLCQRLSSEFWDITADRCRYWDYLEVPGYAATGTILAQKHA
ncbi:hypothetical protein [Acetobacter sp. DmW_136]|uniref:hypothetical protein n=1 Tax=Acetobacter sp. DmW_136 TaxID=2591091 RepID=UPI00140B5EF7|nr:hypothetical protein [Acetobacter sp. DmW_136]